MLACHRVSASFLESLLEHLTRTYAARPYPSSANRQAGHPTPFAVLSLTSFFTYTVAAS